MKKQRESGDHDGAPPRHVCCSLKKNSKQKHDKLGRSAAGDDLITAVEVHRKSPVHGVTERADRLSATRQI